ncbi:unnamed protein product, partial [Symbiodinium microadriaticum]
ERAFLSPHAQEPAQQAKAKAQADVARAKEQLQDGAQCDVRAERKPDAAEGEDGPPADGAEGKDGPPADGAERKAVKAKPSGPGAASGSNFAGRTPPNTTVHPRIKPGKYQKSQGHFWKYIVDMMDLADVEKSKIGDKVQQLADMYVIPAEHTA